MTRTYAAPLTHSDLESTLRSAIRTSNGSWVHHGSAQIQGALGPLSAFDTRATCTVTRHVSGVLKSFEFALGPFIRRSFVVAPAPSLLISGHGDVSAVVVLPLIDRRDAVDDRLVSEVQLPRSEPGRARSLALLQDALGRGRLSVSVRRLLGGGEAALVQAGVAGRGADGGWRKRGTSEGGWLER